MQARRLMAQLAADCALLEELRVMDYSLLLGVHSRSAEGYTSAELITDRVRRPAPALAMVLIKIIIIFPIVITYMHVLYRNIYHDQIL